MKYLINSIKELEEFITPSLEIDDIFNFFMFPKFEKQFMSSMRFYRIETFGEDYEKFPISFKEFNPKYDKFYGLNYNLLEEIIDFKEFKNDLKNCFIDSEDSYIREINEQIQNPSEAQFKIYLYNTLKNLKDSYEFLSSTQIENNRILNLIKKELLDSYKRTYIKIKNEVPIYDDIFETFLFSNKSLKRIEQPSVDFFENKQDYNPFPRVFINNDKFLFFEELKNNLCTDKKTQLADFSFVFRMMQKEKYIYSDVSEKSFREFLTNNYEITFDKLKTYEYSVTAKKIKLYNSLKK
jgi:hypothetical protein